MVVGCNGNSRWLAVRVVYVFGSRHRGGIAVVDVVVVVVVVVVFPMVVFAVVVVLGVVGEIVMVVVVVSVKVNDVFLRCTV